MIVLVGFMGAGKTSVGRLLAQHLGLPFVDTDSIVETDAGKSIASIFTDDGEAAFRALERGVVALTLAGPDAVVALGGGAVTDPATCTDLEWTTVIHLDAPYAESMRRIGADPGRPLLTFADPKALYGERRVVYERVADVTVDTSQRTAEEVVHEIVARLEPTGSAGSDDVRRVVVGLGARSYEVSVGAGVTGRADQLLPDTPGAEQVMVVMHPSLERMSGSLLSSLEARGLNVHVVAVPEGEDAKSLETAEALYARFGDADAHRGDLVVSFGGGVICDVAGFVASTYNRGMPVVHVPTTLLAQVDAAIGGKTGVNTNHGKNLVGTFYQPVAVLCDVSLLADLSDEELRSGLAEVCKYGFIADPSLLELLEQRRAGVFARDPEVMMEIVARSAAIKAEIVADDELETTGRRAHLNYGHTFAHAIETTAGFGTVRHGEAVAIGMMAAAYLARELDRLDDDAVMVHRRILGSLGLPVTATLDVEALEQTWKRDKKYRGGVRFVLLSGIGRPESGIEAPRDAVVRAVERLKS
jgi:3-dehydroquinate synthase/shikimate kinase/3-dehydroquinate synthase